jgi:hypothetical protein
MKKYIYTATVEIEANSKEDAEIEIINIMDEHDILWECEEN